MPVDQLLRRVAVVVEARGRHHRLELLHPRLALGNARLEIGDALLQGFARALLLLPLCLDALAVFAAGFGLRASGCGRLRGFGLRATGCGGLSGYGLWATGRGFTGYDFRITRSP